MSTTHPTNTAASTDWTAVPTDTNCPHCNHPETITLIPADPLRNVARYCTICTWSEGRRQTIIDWLEEHNRPFTAKCCTCGDDGDHNHPQALKNLGWVWRNKVWTCPECADEARREVQVTS